MDAASTLPPPEEPRARLVAAAEETFRRYGYRRTTIDDITTRARTGKGSLYLHFTSKQGIYLEVVRLSLERFVERATRVLHTDEPVPQRMRNLIQLTVEHYGTDELLHASLFGGQDLVDGDVSRLAASLQRDRVRTLLEEVLHAGQQEGTVRADLDAAAVAAVLFETGWALVKAELEGDARIPLDRALATLNEIVGLGIMPRRHATDSRTAPPR